MTWTPFTNIICRLFSIPLLCPGVGFLGPSCWAHGCELRSGLVASRSPACWVGLDLFSGPPCSSPITSVLVGLESRPFGASFLEDACSSFLHMLPLRLGAHWILLHLPIPIWLYLAFPPWSGCQGLAYQHKTPTLENYRVTTPPGVEACNKVWI